ncbi:hypothetical protein D5R81_17880 [Parashewanella spongiae]|uniref:Uncharacterized protein n=1 Tax=Parashewanella spongiae TaxID=342950 RepID=A0A3A6T5E1_9GAMM|nr:hypothetical protein [Parashewanella spongiae]MCL1079929.1 hypothetical protein [Parashewanella spongiae]RJY06345.1 hypothetical protein D5R81_17880 [Parashewanella spongiae]
MKELDQANPPEATQKARLDYFFDDKMMHEIEKKENERKKPHACELLQHEAFREIQDKKLNFLKSP